MDIVFRCLFPFAIFFNQSTVDATPWHWPNNVEHTNGIDHHFFLSPFFFFRFSSFFSGFESLLLLFLFINISLRQGEWEEEFVSSGCEINFEHWNGTVFRCFFFFFLSWSGERAVGRLVGWLVGCCPVPCICILFNGIFAVRQTSSVLRCIMSKPQGLNGEIHLRFACPTYFFCLTTNFRVFIYWHDGVTDSFSFCNGNARSIVLSFGTGGSRMSGEREKEKITEKRIRNSW